ncbi:MAG: KH domain-containing protein [Candidatus Thermoplasmatota archaeon]|jgi:ribosomal RNA assembly protein|nr:KH domain-containing protein [Candidatus Thermoplasmatota archaeon]
MKMLYLKIPHERIPILVGTNGEVKREIEIKTGIRVLIDSEEGTVDLDETFAKDPLFALKVRDVVKAIARGFSPEKAMDIIELDLYFALVDIREYTGKKPKRIREMKGRMIGKEGKTKRIIEQLGDCKLSIYGHTVAIIGDYVGIDISRTAVDMVLSGSKHASVYGYLERKRREARTSKIENIYEMDDDKL